MFSSLVSCRMVAEFSPILEESVPDCVSPLQSSVSSGGTLSVNLRRGAFAGRRWLLAPAARSAEPIPESTY
jgi:uracil phosphoribosyltransferase